MTLFLRPPDAASILGFTLDQFNALRDVHRDYPIATARPPTRRQGARIVYLEVASLISFLRRIGPNRFTNTDFDALTAASYPLPELEIS